MKNYSFHTALNPSLTRFLPWHPFFLFHIENFSSVSFWRTTTPWETDTSCLHTAPISYCKTSSIFHLLPLHDSGIIICKVWRLDKYWKEWFLSPPAWTGLNIHRQSEYSCLQAWRNLSCVCSLHCRNPISQFSLQNCSEEFLWYQINPTFVIDLGGTPLVTPPIQIIVPTMKF